MPPHEHSPKGPHHQFYPIINYHVVVFEKSKGTPLKGFTKDIHHNTWVSKWHVFNNPMDIIMGLWLGRFIVNFQKRVGLKIHMDKGRS
jgi:hypothetical protein